MSMQAKDLGWSKIDSFAGNTTSPVLTAYRPCPVCGGLSCQTMLQFDEFQFFTDSLKLPKRTMIRDVQCNDCHAVFKNPCYTNAGFAILFAEAGQSYGSSEGRPLEQVDWMGRQGLLTDGAIILDAGCYEGRFLACLPSNLKRMGVDIDQPAVDRGNARYANEDITLIQGAFESFISPVAPDVITMFHVLEHLADPYAVLCHLRRISHDQTRLVIEIPILEHGFTNDINGFLSAQHMTHFSFNTIGQIAVRAGWEIVTREQQPDYNGHRLIFKQGPIANEVQGDVGDRDTFRRYLVNWHQVLSTVSKRMIDWPRKSKAVIWGGGMHSEFAYQVTPMFHAAPDREYIMVDSDPMKQGKSWRGLQIHAPSVLEGMSWDDCDLIISSYGGQGSIFKAAQALGVPEDRILQIYDCVVSY